MTSFGRVIVADFEYEVSAGELPVPLCLVAHELDENLNLVREIKVWRGEFGPAPPFDIGNDTLFVAYSAWAEMTCFLALGWEFPKYIFDQHTAYLAASNFLLAHDEAVEARKRKKESKGLTAACRRYGLDGWEMVDSKKWIASAIGNGTWRQDGYTREDVFAYCAEDVAMSVKLLRRQLRPHRFGSLTMVAADVERVIWWSEYSAKCVAQIQARGMPIDMETWNLVQEHKHEVVRDLIRRFDPSFGDDEPIFGSDGEFSYDRFEAWLVRNRAPFWPRLETGRLAVDDDSWKMMAWFPGVSQIGMLRKSLSFILRARLPIGRDGRNRPSIFPFGTRTGRNAHAKSTFNAHAGTRGFMLFPPETIGIYADWRCQEVAVAAALSGDRALHEAYASGDVYHKLALLSGENTDQDMKRWKRENEASRQKMKSLQLGINYCMGVNSLARGLNNSHPYVASVILDRYERTYPDYVAWRKRGIEAVMVDRKVESVFGWPMHLTTSPNPKTLANFPMQSGGADMLRLAVMQLCKEGIIPIMLIHDGILFEETDHEKIERAKQIMAWAGREVCGEVGCDVGEDQRRFGDDRRFADKRPEAKAMWASMMNTLANIGATRSPADVRQ
jgi:hypothetical protein